MRQQQEQNLMDRSGQHRVIVHTPEPGAGAGQYVAEFVKSLAARGTRIVLFCPANFSYVQEVAASGAAIVHAPVREVGQAHLCRRLYRNVAFLVGGLAKFWATLKQGDIVHFQFALQLGLGLLFFFAARMKGAFVVLTVHDPLPHRWILPRPFRWLETAFLSIGYSLCDRLVVHNQVGRRILVEQFHMDSTMVSVIPHGPLNAASPALLRERTPDGAEPLRLLAFGSLRENKGLHLSIAAVQRMRRLPLTRPVCLTIAGCAPNARERTYWESCRRLIQEQPNGIEVIERLIEEAEIGPLFAAHDAVLLPYVRFFSDSGVAMLAVSQRRPILATPSGGLGELLQAADCGILIEAATVDAVVAAIENARLAPIEWLRQKGLSGYNFALGGRSWAAGAELTQNLYNSFFESPCPSGKGPGVILHTLETASSTVQYIGALSKALATDGVPVKVLSPVMDLRVSGERNMRTKVSPLTKSAETLRFVFSSALTLLRAANAGDVVHFLDVLPLPFRPVLFACAWAKRTHIVNSVHDCTPPRFGFGWAYRWSDALIVRSDDEKRKLAGIFQVPARKIHVIDWPLVARETLEVYSRWIPQLAAALMPGEEIRETVAPQGALS